jgi:HAD superfamily hydrolase (TIGR01549 family)
VPSRFAYDAVLFDIDGTLLATDAFWLDVGRRGVREVYARHGIERVLPPDRLFLEAIGKPMTEFWEHVLPRDLHHLGEEVELACEEMEEAAFRAGKGAFYPGARSLLDELRADGVRIGLASNCSRRYLESFLAAFELDGVVDMARCAESPGIRSKADMIAELLGNFGTRNAVMIGDRESDREAAAANRVPFILFTGGFGGPPPAPGDRVALDYREVRRALLAPSGP